MPADDATTPANRVAQGDATVAIVTLAESGLDRPKKLDNTTDASYDERFEADVVRQLIRNGGGAGDIEVTTPSKLGIPNTLVEDDADATWVFMPWEGVQAEGDGIELNAFALDDGVPYGYTLVLFAHPERIESGDDELAHFLAATALGYEFAAESPEESLIRTLDGDRIGADEIDVTALYTNAPASSLRPRWGAKRDRNG